MCRNSAHSRKESEPRLTGKAFAWWGVGCHCQGSNTACPVPCPVPAKPPSPHTWTGTGASVQGTAVNSHISHRRTLRIVEGRKDGTTSTRWKERNIAVPPLTCAHMFSTRGVGIHRTNAYHVHRCLRRSKRLSSPWCSPYCGICTLGNLPLTETVSSLWSCHALPLPHLTPS